jgi:aspartyl-tRNA(Asn)/glutamyl-tRNA(Gln) amidotransferase subunit A
VTGPAPTGSATSARPTDPAAFGLLEAAAALRSRAFSAVELTEACLRRIDEVNGGEPSFDGGRDAVNAWVRLYPDLALEHARSADERLAREGVDAPLVCGIPLALKDLYGMAGLPLTASSRVLEGNVASDDAVAWRRLRDAGMVPLGHTHTHEFAAGGTTDQVGNPHALGLVAGGSSGGSAAALAARMTPAALGSDTCGSLRIPAACCGVSSIKPTHGRIPIGGVIPLSATLDHVGPMGRSVADCSALLAVLAEGGPEVSSLMPPPQPLGELPLAARPGPRPLEGLTVALTDRPTIAEMRDEVAGPFDVARRACEELGARVVELSAPWTFDWNDLSVVLMSDVWSYHSQFADKHDLYRPAIAEFVEVARRFTDAQAYVAAQDRRARGTAAWEDWFEANGVDFVLEPTLPIVPYERGPGYDRGHAGGPGDPMIALTALWDMTGMPVVTLPVQWNVAVSLIGPRGHEAPLTQAGIDLQEHALSTPNSQLPT